MIRRKPRRDPVTPTVRAFVLQRDRACLAWKVDPTHVCKDRWSQRHSPGDLWRLTLDHVHDHAMLGKRAPSDAAHLVALCWDANVNGWASAHRVEERAYLAALQAPEHEHVDPVPGCADCYQAFG